MIALKRFTDDKGYTYNVGDSIPKAVVDRCNLKDRPDLAGKPQKAKPAHD